jgi:hypothetical protein
MTRLLAAASIFTILMFAILVAKIVLSSIGVPR